LVLPDDRRAAIVTHRVIFFLQGYSAEYSVGFRFLTCHACRTSLRCFGRWLGPIRTKHHKKIEQDEARNDNQKKPFLQRASKCITHPSLPPVLAVAGGAPEDTADHDAWRRCPQAPSRKRAGRSSRRRCWRDVQIAGCRCWPCARRSSVSRGEPPTARVADHGHRVRSGRTHKGTHHVNQQG
jgi:hypothetical protein